MTYRFEGGFPDDETIRAAYDAADMARAVVCYKHFFPVVSGLSILSGQLETGARFNRVFSLQETAPRHRGLTLNSDTPYAGAMLDLHGGALALDIPAGPITGSILDADQGWVADVGVPGPDGGHGGHYTLLPPGTGEDDPADPFTLHASTFRLIAGLRAVPLGGDLEGAVDLLRSVRVSPVGNDPDWVEPQWSDVTARPQDGTPNAFQGTLAFWSALHGYLSDEPLREGDRAYVGELSALGIRPGEPFVPDERMRALLTAAAEEADAQMRVQSLADRRPDRVVWPDRRWEWVSLRPEGASFTVDDVLDVDARDTWFYQAIATSPAMFHREAGAGSVYWFGAHDSSGAYLDGGRTYRLTVPLPVPAGQFWSVTAYDAQTRSQVSTDQGSASLRSLFELRDRLGGDSVTLWFGPEPPADATAAWVRTVPGRGWFSHLRVYGPGEAVFDGSWRPGDFEAMRRP